MDSPFGLGNLQLQILNNSSHTALFDAVSESFQNVDDSVELSDKIIISGKTYYYCPQQCRYVIKYFELQADILIKFESQSKKSDPQFIYCHLFKLYEDNV